MYSRQSFGQTEALVGLREAAEHRGNTVVATFADDPALLGKGKYNGWRALVARLEDADQVVIGSVGDLPGRKVQDLFKILDLLRNHNVGLYSRRERISTDDGAAAILDLIAAYRAAKVSQAIRFGQAKARAAGKRIGRPLVPPVIQNRIRAALANGTAVRPTARRFGVSPATVINIRRTLNAEPDKIAALFQRVPVFAASRPRDVES
jgi:DNA invertase Pin-like site-specific DNA recombinase